jgi:hypothetical protein
MSSSQHIINPKTQRPVKIGSRTWRKLVSDGIIENQKIDEPCELYELSETDNIEQKINELNKSLPITEQAVRGRGRFRNKVVKRRKQPSTEIVAEHTIKTTAGKLRDRNTYESLHENGNFDEDLETMIMRELSKSLNVKAPPEYQVNNNIVEEDDEDYDDESSEDYDEYDDDSEY